MPGKLTVPATQDDINATYQEGLIKLSVGGEDFCLEPCRPGDYNLVREKMNRVVRAVPVNIKTADLLTICLKDIKEG